MVALLFTATLISVRQGNGFCPIVRSTCSSLPSDNECIVDRDCQPVPNRPKPLCCYNGCSYYCFNPLPTYPPKRGDPGSRGLNGDPGDRGGPGVQEAQGPQEYPGATGNPGPGVDPGEPGVQGAAGPSGGSVGGLMGQDGIPGPPGPPDSPGEKVLL